MSPKRESRARTIAIVLGASNFRKSPTLNRTSFARSAENFVSYLLDKDLFALAQEDLLNLFESLLSPGDQLEKACDFLDERSQRAAGGLLDLILYYVGHGGFVGAGKEYFLAISGTKEGLEGSSSIRIGDLSFGLANHARSTRKYLILDSCFAASALSDFQGLGLANLISRQTREPLPARGTALLCSSGSHQVSIAPADEQLTMFSGALMKVLREGEACGEAAFSLEGVGARVKELLRHKYPQEWIRPEVHSPDMHEGDIADIPIFPNPQFDPNQNARSSVEYVTTLELQLQALRAQLSTAQTNLERSYDITLETLGDALDLRDVEKEGHSKRVTAFSIAIARALRVSKGEIDIIARGAFLHDVGKMAIPDAILRKDGHLTSEEMTTMRGHCLEGYKIVRRIPFLSGSAEIVYAHHERYDGTGYPRGLKGQEIPLGARIFALADALEAITLGRSYRPARPLGEAIQEIRRLSGQQFDPDVVNAFLRMDEQLWTDLRKEIDKQVNLGL